MKNLKEKILKVFQTLKKAIGKFPLTMIGVLLLTVIYTICLDNKLLSANSLENITIFIIVFVSSTFGIETFMSEKKTKNIVGYVLAGIIATVFTIFLNVENGMFGMSEKIFLFRMKRLLICYLISAIILAIYGNYKKSNQNFQEYVTSTAIKLFKTSFIYCILAIGIAIIAAIFVYLILDGKGYSLVARLEILLLGIYYVPTVIYGFYDTVEEVGKFAKFIIKYILGTLVLTSFIIIYLYMIKIIIFSSVPSNQIFRILSALFIVGLPVWTMISSWEEDTILDKINRKLPFLFIPFIILQIYSIGTRIRANGMTEPRYLCVMLIILEIIYIIIYWKNKEKVGNLLIVGMVVTIISTVFPYINMFAISNISQYQNLKIYQQKEEFSEDEMTKIYGAYYYLQHSIEGEKYVDELLTEKDKDAILELRKSSLKQDSKQTIAAVSESDSIEIDGYKKLYYIEAYQYYESDYSETIEERFHHVVFKIGDFERQEIEVDISTLMNQWIKYKDDLDQYFDENNELVISEKQKIILKSLSVQYNEETKKVTYYHMEGYLLEK